MPSAIRWVICSTQEFHGKKTKTPESPHEFSKKPQLAGEIKARLELPYRILDNKYYFDRFNEIVFAATSRGIGQVLWRLVDALMIDGLVVNGSARLVGWVSSWVRYVQTGYLNHYAFAMISGLILLLGWAVLG